MVSRRLGVEAAIVDGALLPGDVAIEDDRVVGVGLSPAGGGGLAAPGFVDLQVNGFAGVDFTDADLDGYQRAGRAMAATGVTAYQPTLITLPEESYLSALSRAAEAQRRVDGPRILGVHLEGPFLSPDRAGAHDPALMVPPDADLAVRLFDAGPVTHLTIAPELSGALDVIDLAVDRGVTVSLGHSAAEAATTRAAFDHGARAITHLFNAQRPFTHRDPGIAFAGLARPGVTVTLIVDGIHLADETVQVAFAAAGGRAALITDAVSAAGLEAGTYRIGTRTIHHDGHRVTLDDGTLAGSALTMDNALRNLIDLGIPLPAAIDAATRIPGRLAAKPGLGALLPGAPADLVILDDHLQVTRTLVRGKEAFPGSER